MQVTDGLRKLVPLALLLAVGGCAGRPVAPVPFPATPSPGTVYHSLHRPDGPGPFPAVVLLHTCGGLQRHVHEWARRLRDHGYAALVVDSFTPRGATWVCGNWAVSLDEVTADAYAALAHLKTQPFVDGRRVGVMGFSYGAMAALRLTSIRYRGATHPRAASFGAAVALYPSCADSNPRLRADARDRLNNLYDDVDTPLLILLAGEDDQTSPTACADKADALHRAGQPVSYKLYPGATHGFDMSNVPPGGRRDAQGHFFRYDPDVTGDAAKVSLEFFDRRLR